MRRALPSVAALTDEALAKSVAKDGGGSMRCEVKIKVNALMRRRKTGDKSDK